MGPSKRAQSAADEARKLRVAAEARTNALDAELGELRSELGEKCKELLSCRRDGLRALTAREEELRSQHQGQMEKIIEG